MDERHGKNERIAYSLAYSQSHDYRIASGIDLRTDPAKCVGRISADENNLTNCVGGFICKTTDLARHAKGGLQTASNH